MTDTKRPTNPLAEEILNLYFPILDYGFLALRDYMATDQCIESGARISYSGGGTRKTSETRGLIRYLRRHAHTSPSELLTLKFHMCAPIFVLRQFFRHRTLSANELSGRYSLLPMLFYTPDQKDFKKQSKNNNQGRADQIESKKYKLAVERWNKLRNESRQLYEDLAAEDVARELARIDLPLSTYSQLYFSINLHNAFHFLGLRADSHAQYEIQAYAQIMAGMIKRIAPLSYEAWIDYQFCASRFTRLDLLALQEQFKTGSVSDEFMLNIGMSKREIVEYKQKLVPKEPPNYDLDLTTAKSPQYFENLMNSAVPKIDNKFERL